MQNAKNEFVQGCTAMLKTLRGDNHLVEASSMLEAASRAGHAEAMNMFGILLVRSGKLQEGYKWISESAINGNQMAIKNKKTMANLMGNSTGIVKGALYFNWDLESTYVARTKYKTPSDIDVLSVLGDISIP